MRIVANAVARVENLEFLTDVVPKTTTYRQFKQKQAKDASTGAQEQEQSANSSALANGQRTLDRHMHGDMGIQEAMNREREQKLAKEREQQQATNGATASPIVEVDPMDVDSIVEDHGGAVERPRTAGTDLTAASGDEQASMQLLREQEGMQMDGS